MTDKYVSVASSGNLTEVTATVTSSGVANAGNVVALDSTGHLDNTVLPTGLGAETASIVCSENLASGDLVNIYNNAGTPNCRKADASAANAGKLACGFVLSTYTSAQSATVYLDGTVSGLTGLTAGTAMFLSGTTPGATTATAPTTTGYICQNIGIAISTTAMRFIAGRPVIRA